MAGNGSLGGDGDGANKGGGAAASGGSLQRAGDKLRGGLCIFSMPRAFVGEDGVRQRNAARSWRRVAERVVLLRGAEGSEGGDGWGRWWEGEGGEGLGTVDWCEMGGGGGLPLMSEVFAAGERCCGVGWGGVFGYVNGDIILRVGLRRVLGGVVLAAEGKEVMVTSSRLNVGVGGEIDFSVEGVDDLLGRGGGIDEASGFDAFFYTAGFWRGGVGPGVPRMYVGRYWFDWALVNGAKMTGHQVRWGRCV